MLVAAASYVNRFELTIDVLSTVRRCKEDVFFFSVVGHEAKCCLPRTRHKLFDDEEDLERSWHRSRSKESATPCNLGTSHI